MVEEVGLTVGEAIETNDVAVEAKNGQLAYAEWPGGISPQSGEPLTLGVVK
jgi:hypothetical protein